MEDVTRKNRGGHHKGNSTEALLDKERILEALQIQPGETIVDVGCGNGYMSKEFSKLVGQSGKVYALDRSDEAIERLKQETGGTVITPLQADISQQAPVEGQTVDMIYLSTVFHIFSPEQVAGFMREVDRLLKPGGRLAIVEIHKTDTPFGPPADMRCSPEELQQVITLEPDSLIEAGQYFYMQTFRKI